MNIHNTDSDQGTDNVNQAKPSAQKEAKATSNDSYYTYLAVALAGFSKGINFHFLGSINNLRLIFDNAPTHVIAHSYLGILAYNLKPILTLLFEHRHPKFLFLITGGTLAALAIALNTIDFHHYLFLPILIALGLVSAVYDIDAQRRFFSKFSPQSTNIYAMAGRASRILYGYMAVIIAQYYGWLSSSLFFASIVIITTWFLYTALPESQSRGARSSGDTSNIYRALCSLRSQGIGILMVMTLRMSSTFIDSMMGKFFKEQGLSMSQIAFFSKISGTLLIIAGGFAFTRIYARYKSAKPLAVLALIELAIHIIFRGWQWLSLQQLIGLSMFSDFIRGAITTAFLTHIGQMCYKKDYDKFQYSLLCSIAYVPGSLLVLSLGGAASSWPTFFNIGVGINILSVMILLVYLRFYNNANADTMIK